MNQIPPDTNNPMIKKSEREAEVSSIGNAQPKEVDYYLNPTELFRWINYRRWEGAKARVLSHPDECSTWIVSRHSTDGRILWKHLPLHLVCMQSGDEDTDAQYHSRPIEELADILLEAYPEGSSKPDDQGMLPLHLAVTSGTLNTRLIYLLLTAYPNGVNSKDEFGSTPIDLLAEKKDVPNYDDVSRAMTRVQRSLETHNSTIRKENSALIESLKKSSSNERSASQQIMLKLERDLVEARKKVEKSESKTLNEEKKLSELRTQIETLQSEKEEIENSINGIRVEQDELINQNEILRNQVKEHERIVKILNQSIEDNEGENKDTITKLKSECSTAKSMVEALESQLRSRFTDEESLSASVSKLESELVELRAEYKEEKLRLLRERDSYENENIQLQRSNEELSKKSAALQSKLAEVNKEMGAVLRSHGDLNAEHDRMTENTLSVEANLIESMRMERTNLLASMRKQMEFFKSTIQSEGQLLKNCEQNEMELLELANKERNKNLEAIKSLRQDFLNARTSALQRQRLLHTDRLATTSSHKEAKKSLDAEDGKSIISNCSSLDRSTVSQRGNAQKMNSFDYSSTTPRNNKKEFNERDGKSIISNCSSLDRSTVSQRGNAKTMDSFDCSVSTPRNNKKEFNERYLDTVSRGRLHQPVIETRFPSSSDKFDPTENRQQPAAARNGIESNMLHLLETRTNRENSRHRRQEESEYDSDTDRPYHTVLETVKSLRQNYLINAHVPALDS